MMYGRWARGLAHFVTIGLTFAFGLALHSSVVWPSWSIRSEDFNLINNFTFLVQMGGGIWAVASFAASTLVHEPQGFIGVLAGVEHHPHFELGSYFMIVAGALNYLALGNFYDRIVHPHPRFAAQETESREQAA